MKIPVIDMTPKVSGKEINNRWWLEEEPHTHAWSIAKKLQAEGSARRSDNLRNARLYSNKAFLSLSMAPVSRNIRSTADASRLTPKSP